MPRPVLDARWRLVCLPHAGAGASVYFSWARELERCGIEVRAAQYPGRETRLAEDGLTGGEDMVAALAEVWPELSGGERCALYGHSMGAMLAFELAAELERRGIANPPERVILSGCNPPHLPLRVPRVHGLPDEELLAKVQERYGNFPEELLADRSFLQLIVPVLRADFTLVSNYVWRGAGPLGSPLTILGGTRDPETTPAELIEWSRHTRASCRVQMFEGDHFFNQTARTAVLDLIRAELAQ